METRLSRELDSMLVESYVNLDCNQLDSSKVVSLFKRVYPEEDYTKDRVRASQDTIPLE